MEGAGGGVPFQVGALLREGFVLSGESGAGGVPRKEFSGDGILPESKKTVQL